MYSTDGIDDNAIYIVNGMQMNADQYRKLTQPCIMTAYPVITNEDIEAYIKLKQSGIIK